MGTSTKDLIKKLEMLTKKKVILESTNPRYNSYYRAFLKHAKELNHNGLLPDEEWAEQEAAKWSERVTGDLVK